MGAVIFMLSYKHKRLGDDKVMDGQVIKEDKLSGHSTKHHIYSENIKVIVLNNKHKTKTDVILVC